MDSTLFVEHTVLSILPSIIFICASAQAILSAEKKSRRVNRGVQLMLKLGLCSALVGIQIILLTSWVSKRTVHGSVPIAASIFRLAVSSMILHLSCREYRGWVQPSMLTSSYLALTILLELAEARTLWSRFGHGPIAAFFSASIASKFVLLLLQELSKPPDPFNNKWHTARDSASGLSSRALSWCSTSLFIKGRRGSLTNDDLGDFDEKFDASALLVMISSTWDSYTAHYHGRNLLAWVILKTFKRHCLVIAVPRLFLSAFLFAQPFLINRVIDFVEEPSARYNQEMAYGLIAATFFVYAGISITRCFYKHLISQLVTMIRGALLGMIYQKTLNLESDSISDLAPVTLMSTDIDGILSATQSFYDLWPGVIELCAGLILLHRKAGHASLLVLVPGVLCWLVSRRVSKTMILVQRTWNEAIQTRISVISSTLGQIKGIKMLGLSDYMSQVISNFRAFELSMSQTFRTVLAWVTSFSAAVNSLSPIVVMIAAVLMSKSPQELAASNIFTVLSIVILVAQPLSNLIGSYTVLMPGLACCSRIQSFLQAKEKTDRGGFLESLQAPRPSANEICDFSGESSLELLALSDHASKVQSVIVDIRQANFITNDLRTKLLYDVNLKLPAGSISMVTGPVGCGKSSLLKGIIGELHTFSGSVRLATSSVAYCDQDPWLRNISVRDNILGPLPFDKEWYSQVITACALERDLDSFPRGDKTLVGSGGIALSGGQRQRVGLARAVYSRHSLVLLDDVLSGLDSTTSAAVFTSLLGDDGLLRRGNITVLFATHSIHFLHKADFVTILEPNRIKYNQVKFDSIDREMRSALRTYVKTSRLSTQSDPEFHEKLNELSIPKSTVRNAVHSDPTHRPGDFGLYLFYLGSIGPVFALTLLFLAISFSVLKKMPQIWLRIWSDHGMDKDQGHFLRAYLAIAAAYLASIWLLCRFFLVHVVSRSSRNLHKLLLAAVVKAPLHFFTSTDNGATLNRFSQDMTIIDQMLPASSFNALRDTFNILVEIVIITSGARYVVVIIPFCMVTLYFVQTYYLRISRQIRNLDLEAKAPLYTHFSETLSGLITIRAMGWEAYLINENNEHINRSQTPFYLVYCLQKWLNLVSDFSVCHIATIFVAVVVLMRDSSSKAATGLAMLNIISFNNTLSFLINSWTNLETALGAVARLRTFLLETPVEALEVECQELPHDWPTKGDIEFNNVTSSHAPALAPTIKGVSLNIKAGQKVGIYGRTGSGKSSLILTLLRLLDLRSGFIRIDGLDLGVHRREAIRSRILTLPQQPVILPGTVRENLYAGAHVIFSDTELIVALEKTGMWEVVSARGGLGVELGVMGLSVGQKQLFCLSRAILHKTKILLLDEATSSLDHDTEDKLRGVLRAEFTGCTVLEVSHKLEAIASYDVVVIMEDGEVVEVGNPRELLQVDDSKS